MRQPERFRSWLAGIATNKVADAIRRRAWTILQSGTTGAAASASAVAANVPLDAADRVGAAPLHTLRSLPPDGVVIAVTLTTRGNPTTDRAYPVRATVAICGCPHRESGR